MSIRMYDFFENMYLKCRKPYKALIELTQVCNLNCAHCYIKKNDKYISLDDVYYILDNLEQKGFIWIIFTGGEIFTHPNFIDIYIYAKRKGFIIDLKTNALLLNNDIKNVLLKYPPRKLDISIYGLSNKEYGEFTGDFKGFDKLVNSLNWLFNNNFVFQLTVMAIENNYNEIYNGEYDRFFGLYNCQLEFEYDIIMYNENNLKIKLLSTEKIACIEMKSLRYKSYIKDSLVERDNTNFICRGGRKNIFIDVNTNVHICIFDDYSIIFSEFLSSTALINRTYMVESEYRKSKCSKCNERLGCVRCPLRRKITQRDNSSSWRCDLAKIRYKSVKKC